MIDTAAAEKQTLCAESFMSPQAAQRELDLSDRLSNAFCLLLNHI